MVGGQEDDVLGGGEAANRVRIALMVGVLRQSELAELADDPRQAAVVIQAVADWAAGRWGYPAL